MTRSPREPASHDPYWDLDGAGVRRAREQRRWVRRAMLLVGIVVVILVVSRLPAINPLVLTTPEGRPLLAGALLSLLGVSVLLAIARMRYVNRH
ncbi:MAG TPA: hypothetical protein VHS36_03170 [Candidatus Limnocylindrales bacterium]|jgi:hypothetical protein|nr:hypothetical protein [Candidatus Limnocylindrales bacterium]